MLKNNYKTALVTGASSGIGEETVKLLVKNHKYVFLGAWNFKEEIFQKEKKFIKSGGKFITHIPYPRVI